MQYTLILAVRQFILDIFLVFSRLVPYGGQLARQLANFGPITLADFGLLLVSSYFLLFV